MVHSRQRREVALRRLGEVPARRADGFQRETVSTGFLMATFLHPPQ